MCEERYWIVQSRFILKIFINLKINLDGRTVIVKNYKVKHDIKIF